MTVKYIPENYHSVTPYLIVKGADRALAYYGQSFGASEIMRLADPQGRVMHAEMRIGDSTIMLADEFPEMDVHSPSALGGTPVGLCLYVEDVDAVFRRALDAGGKEVRPVQDQFYGDRSGTLLDPFGHKWTVATHKEDVTPEQIGQRAEAWLKQAAGA